MFNERREVGNVLVDTALPCRALALTVATTVVGQNPK